MRELKLEDFSGAVGETFSIEVEGATLGLSLVAAQELPRLVREGGSFRLEWLGPVEPVLPQAIYPIRQGEETYEIFIVPLSTGPSGTRYEAVFN
jgi:hypothetical protein